jgi:hypothetical protein
VPMKTGVFSVSVQESIYGRFRCYVAHREGARQVNVMHSGYGNRIRNSVYLWMLRSRGVSV